MAKVEKKQGFRVKVVMFWTAIICVTLAFLTLFGFMIFSVTTVDSLKDMKRAGLELKSNIELAKEEEYYVYIYSSSSKNNLEKKAEIETAIFSYATFYLKNKRSGAVKIYAYDLDNYASIGSNVYAYLSGLNSEIVQGNIPMLVKVTDADVQNAYTSINTTQSELQTAMKNIKK